MQHFHSSKNTLLILLFGFSLIYQSYSFSDSGSIEGPVKTTESERLETQPNSVNSSTEKLSPSIATKLHIDKYHGFQIKYPPNWKLEQHRDYQTPVSIQNFTTIVSPLENYIDGYQENLILGVTTVDNTDKTLEKAFEQIFAGFKYGNNGSIDINKKTRITVSNQPALRVSMTENQLSPVKLAFKKEMVIIAIPRRTYMLTFTSESGKVSQYLPIFEDMLSTFELL